MYGTLREDLTGRLAEMREAGTYKTELVMTTPQGAHVDGRGRGELLNLCANNYLGLANHPAIVEAAHEALDRWGYGMASVRFICGTQALHRELEERLSAFLGTDDTILFSSCFDANGGLFEALLDERGRGHLRRAQPRVDHRRHPALQGAAAALRERRHGRARGAARGGGRRALPADRDRRRLLDGRLPRPARRDLRPGRAPRRARDGRRLARRRRRRPGRARHARAPRRHRPHRHPHRHARQGDRRRERRLRLRPRARSSSCCASARGRTSSPTASRRRSSAPACARSS